MKKLLFLCLSWLLFHTSGQAQDEMSFTWDLTTNSWASKSAECIVWESSFATMECIRSENSPEFDENKSGYTKFPSDATIRFTPKIKLSSIEFVATTEDYRDKLYNMIPEYSIYLSRRKDPYNSCRLIADIRKTETPSFSILVGSSIRLTSVTLNYKPIPFTPTMTKVNDLYWSTMYLDYPVDIPSGVNAYYVTVEDNVAHLNAIDGVIPANTGVILCSETAGPFQFNQTTNSATTDVSGNRLVGWISDRSISGQDNTYYVLSTKNGQIGFYIPKGTENDIYPIVANKAYLKLNKAVSVKELQFIFDDTPTAVETVREQTGSSHETYNLQGMRVSDDYRGIIIKDGRKVYRK